MIAPTAAEVIRRRRDAQQRHLDAAQQFADGIPSSVGVRAVVVFGSVARGDFHETSDIDVLVVADNLPDRVLDRTALIGTPTGRVQYVAWTTQELHAEQQRGNPIAVESAVSGIILEGRLPDLSQSVGCA